MPGAYYQFYESGTTTPAAVYADGALSTPLTNPVEADSDGRFPAIYLDPGVVYRVQLYDADDTLQEDVDPVNPFLAVPPGTVAWFHGTAEERDAVYPPSLWQVLNGDNGSPNGTGRVPLIAGGEIESGDTGGALITATGSGGAHDHGGSTGSHALTESELPPHDHALPDGVVIYPGDGLRFGANVSFQGHTNPASTDEAGGGEGHTHTIPSGGAHTHDIEGGLPPYVALWALMRRAT